MPAPIALFTYNRLNLTRQTIEALALNRLAGESELHIFSDGGKDAVSWQKVNEVRAYLKTVTGFSKKTIIEKESNQGLSSSIATGVSHLLEKYSSVIVLEDDLITTPYFLQFMNDALECYRDDPQVASVSGYVYPLAEKADPTFFLYGADCWGWATWKRAWDVYENDGRKLLNEITASNQSMHFNFDNSFDYTGQLLNDAEGRNNSWATKWYASAYLKKMYCLYPGVSLVRNAGFDGSGVNCPSGDASPFDGPLASDPVQVRRIPIAQNSYAYGLFREFFKRLQPRKKTFLSRLGRHFGIKPSAPASRR